MQATFVQAVFKQFVGLIMPVCNPSLHVAVNSYASNESSTEDRRLKNELNQFNRRSSLISYGECSLWQISF